MFLPSSGRHPPFNLLLVVLVQTRVELGFDADEVA